MAVLLARLGRFSFRHRRLVIGAWVLLLAAIVAVLAVLGGKFDDRFTIPGTESQTALDRLAAAQPTAAGAGAQIVFVAPTGATVTEPQYAAAIEQVVAAAGKAPQVAAVADPLKTRAISPDGRAALARVEYGVAREKLKETSAAALEKTTTAARDAGLQVAVGGEALAKQA